MKNHFMKTLPFLFLWSSTQAITITATTEEKKQWAFCLSSTGLSIDTTSASQYNSDNQDCKNLHIFTLQENATTPIILKFGDNDEATINTTTQRLTLSNGSTMAFEKILILTGTRPNLPLDNPLLYHGLVSVSTIKTFLDSQNVIITLTSDPLLPLLPFLRVIKEKDTILNQNETLNSGQVYRSVDDLSDADPVFILFNASVL